MDLMGPMQVASVEGKNYIVICVDGFSRYTGIDFLKEKSYTFDAFKRLYVKLKNKNEGNICKIVRIHSDHGKEFKNAIYAKFYDKHGISHEFSEPKIA